MTYSYASILNDSARVRWNIDDVLVSVHDLDFAAPFLPEALAMVEPLALEPLLALRANQIRGHGYVQLFALVERFILPFVMMHAGDVLHSSAERLLALMRFGEEEAKHIALFERFGEAFTIGFGTPCEVVGPSEEVVASVLAESPLAVGFAVLHIEWMTQDHYLASVRKAGGICERYKSLLRCHWLEEAQHARIDTLVLDGALGAASEAARLEAPRGYLRILQELERAFVAQVELDLESFGRDGATLTGAQRDAWRHVQRRAYARAFLGAGVRHPRFREFIDRWCPEAKPELDERALRWSVP